MVRLPEIRAAYQAPHDLHTLPISSVELVRQLQPIVWFLSCKDRVNQSVVKQKVSLKSIQVLS